MNDKQRLLLLENRVSELENDLDIVIQQFRKLLEFLKTNQGD